MTSLDSDNWSFKKYYEEQPMRHITRIPTKHFVSTGALLEYRRKRRNPLLSNVRAINDILHVGPPKCFYPQAAIVGDHGQYFIVHRDDINEWV